jgi:hypothetical protein
VIPPGAQQGAPANGREPELAPSDQVAPERTYQRPASSEQQEAQPEPGGDSSEAELEKVLDSEGSDNATYFEPPKLFDLNDRTASRSIGPVRNAIYQKPVSHVPVAATRLTSAEQARQDAKGWTSASN